MQIYHWPDRPILNASVVTIGTFDGVHLAHRTILDDVVSAARSKKYESVVLTFWPHPRMILSPHDHSLQLLSTQEEKIRLLAETNIDHLVIIPFTEEFSNLSAEAFVQTFLIPGIHTKEIILGYDHHFGKQRLGNLSFLRENAIRFGFKVKEIPKQLIDDATISSTAIREALMQGQVEVAHKLLGKSYQFSGTVVKGNQMGRQIGFPTANILISESYKLIPALGVYAVRISLDDAKKDVEMNGMLNIGIRPTFNTSALTIEAHLFDFDTDLYGQRLTVHLYYKLRDEKKFDGIESLKKQLEIDKLQSVTLLSSS